MKEKSENCKLKGYKDKKMQSKVYEKLDEEGHRGLQCKKESSINCSSTRTDGGTKTIEGKAEVYL